MLALCQLLHNQSQRVIVHPLPYYTCNSSVFREGCPIQARRLCMDFSFAVAVGVFGGCWCMIMKSPNTSFGSLVAPTSGQSGVMGCVFRWPTAPQLKLRRHCPPTPLHWQWLTRFLACCSLQQGLSNTSKTSLHGRLVHDSCETSWWFVGV